MSRRWFGFPVRGAAMGVPSGWLLLRVLLFRETGKYYSGRCVVPESVLSSGQTCRAMVGRLGRLNLFVTFVGIVGLDQ